MRFIQPLIGAAVILGIGFAFSTNRRAINWTTVAWGLGLQLIFAFIVLKTSIGQATFETIGDGAILATIIQSDTAGMLPASI